MDSCVTRRRVVASDRDRRVRLLDLRVGTPAAAVADAGVGSSRRIRPRGTDRRASTDCDDEEDDDDLDGDCC